jgi:hypothetical protein
MRAFRPPAQASPNPLISMLLLVACHLLIKLYFKWTIVQRCLRNIRKELLSRINRIYYLRSFYTTHEHYNYLQLIKTEKYLQKIIKGPA